MPDPLRPPPSDRPGTVLVPAPCRILVVDDHVDAAHMLALLLQLDGHEVAVCTDAAEGRERARAEAFDVVLLDLAMPGTDGLDVARAIRAGGASRRARLVAVTGRSQPEDRAGTARAGFDAHLVKPTDLEALRRQIGRGRAPLEADLAAGLGQPSLHRFLDIWRQLAPPGRWPSTTALLAETAALADHRVVVAVEAVRPRPVLRIVDIGAALRAGPVAEFEGRRLDDAPGSDFSMAAHYATVATSGRPSHERLLLDGAADGTLRFERLVVPATADPASPHPTDLVSLVLFETDPPRTAALERT